MARVTHGVSSRKRRKKVLKAAKGYRAGRGKLYRTAKETVARARAYSYRDRKVKKRDFRSLWVVRINAACKLNGIKYSEFIAGLAKAKVLINRKSLAELAVSHKAAFGKLVDIAKHKK
ncbi:MAG: 50S ribosomal protein L20 [Candidatus Omnitrophica bacterium]|jgi:large subunit ribosomal protein L20|nr:50S ribosomal protein L20 [Candidatus Omnitrophota bacterium]